LTNPADDAVAPGSPAGIAGVGDSAGNRLHAWIERNALLLLAWAIVVLVNYAGIYNHIAQDSWLALVAGRDIAQHGIPHVDTLTVMSHSKRWVDQQWLAQLVIYELWRIGGLGLLAAVYIGLTGAGFALAAALARKLGASERHLTWVLPLATFFYYIGAIEIRTQGFAYVLFVATLWLLTSESRYAESSRVYLVFPILVLWANLHGSVTLGVGVASLYGLTVLIADARARGLGGVRLRGLVFTFLPPLCLLATPYGLQIADYYRVTILNHEFSKVVTEWQPITATFVAVPFFAMVFATIWLLGRSGRRTPAFQHLVLMALAVGAIDAVRNVGWFGLATMMLLPGVVGHALAQRPPAPRRVRLNVAIGASAISLVALATVAVLAKPQSWFTSTYDMRAATIAANYARTHPGADIFADVRFGDWLLWEEPVLAGRIAYDTRFEILAPARLDALSKLGGDPTVGRGILARYGLIVIDPNNKAEARQLLAATGTQVLLRDRGTRHVVVATHPAL
jgi:hypothetical protein